MAARFGSHCCATANSIDLSHAKPSASSLKLQKSKTGWA
jgi:hypothetical protein